MAHKYVAFDIETAKVLEGDLGDWQAHRPLGICCAATLPAGADAAVLWHGKGEGGRPAPRMQQDDVARLIEHLMKMLESGHTILTWNGLGFDFDVLAEESGMRDECRSLALAHVDMMFHVFCQLGFPVSLDRAAQAMKLPGKTEGMSGALAPKLWSQGKHDQVLAYMEQDARTTLDLAQACEKGRRLSWLAQSGKTRDMPLPDGWLNVQQAQELPLPDTSWMDRPMKRSRFTRWML
jgi:hypothetical protein